MSRQFLFHSVVKRNYLIFQRNCYSRNEGKPGDRVTHTGQSWDEDDPRMVRFTVAPKQVNESWPINLIKEATPIPVKSRIAICEGGPSPALGHPKIYINLDEPGDHSCIYCGNRFYKEGHPVH